MNPQNNQINPQLPPNPNQNPIPQPQNFTQSPIQSPQIFSQPNIQPPQFNQPQPFQTPQSPQPLQTPQPQQTPNQNQPITTQSSNPAPVSQKQDHPLSTHSYLAISELRDGMAIMKDGSFRVVIACQSINFDLMSENEKEGVEYSFQSFLNSLNFTTQILVRSQRIDISPYIDKLIDIRRKNDNMLLGVLMDDYINFIDALSQEANIMDKSFFIIIPYYSSAEAEKLVQETKNFFASFSRKTAPEITKIDRQTYSTALSEINKRADAVMSGLFRIGIRSVKLNTKELAQLYYNFNNPDTSVREPLVDFTKVAGLYVKKGQ